MLDAQEHQSDLEDLAEAKREAQTADEESAALAAQEHQMQLEVSAKQARSWPLFCIALGSVTDHVGLYSEPSEHALGHEVLF